MCFKAAEVAIKFRHVIWDWNGTLFHDVPLCLSIINGMLAQRRLPAITLDRYRAHFTFPIQDYYRTVGFDFARESFEDLSKEFIAFYEARRHECTLHPHGQRLLERVAAFGRSQSILSAYPQQALVELVDAFGLTHLFDRVVGLDNICAESKVTQGHNLVSELPCRPDEVLLVGDTLHDVEVAKALGTDCVLVAHGHQSKERLRRSGVPVVDSLEELERAALAEG